MSNQKCRYCGCSSKDQYRAELYDEVWQKARDMGYGNVTDALVALERMRYTQPAVHRIVESLPARVSPSNGYDAAWCAGFNEGVSQSRENIERLSTVRGAEHDQ